MAFDINCIVVCATMESRWQILRKLFLQYYAVVLQHITIAHYLQTNWVWMITTSANRTLAQCLVHTKWHTHSHTRIVQINIRFGFHGSSHYYCSFWRWWWCICAVVIAFFPILPRYRYVLGIGVQVVVKMHFDIFIGIVRFKLNQTTRLGHRYIYWLFLTFPNKWFYSCALIYTDLFLILWLSVVW